MKALLILFVLLLSGCGFHLRGMIEMPCWLKHVAIITKDKDMEFISMLRSRLESYHIEVNPDTDPYWLMLDGIHYQKQIVSVGSSTNPRQFQLILAIEFSLQTCKGEVLMPAKRVLVTRQLTVNNDRILGSNYEEHVLMNEMRQDAVIQIINRLGSID